MMECLLAEMNAKIKINRAKTDSNLKEMKDEMTARLEAKVEANHYMMEASQEEMKS
jgi:hypothetical protein